jgi:hypothetical protein
MVTKYPEIEEFVKGKLFLLKYVDYKINKEGMRNQIKKKMQEKGCELTFIG